MKKMLIHMFTGKDNETFDMVKVFGALAILLFFAGITYNTITTGSFDATGYCTNLALLFAALAGGVKIKETTEPDVVKNDVKE
jgi:hypothetical protein